jgi:hypothetical protein
MNSGKLVQTRPHSAEHGQDAVEFAIIGPILLLIIIFIVDLGRVTYFAAVLHNAAREGARYASIEPTDIVGIETVVESMALGIAPDDLSIDITDDPDAKTVVVLVSYELPIFTPLVGAFLGGADTVLLGSQSTLGYEQ